MKLFVTLVVWTGCLLPYLASSRQQLLASKLPRFLSWCGFTLLQAIAIYGLGTLYSTLISGLIVLMLVMCMWVGLILVASHLSGRLLLVSTIGLAFFSAVTLTGMNHVA